MAVAKTPDESVISAMRKDAADGMNVNAIANKHGVGWITAKKYAGSSNGKNGKAPAGGGVKHSKSNGGMDSILEDLRARRDKLTAAINALESL